MGVSLYHEVLKRLKLSFGNNSSHEFNKPTITSTVAVVSNKLIITSIVALIIVIN